MSGSLEGLRDCTALRHLRLSSLKQVGGTIFPALAKMRKLQTLMLDRSEVQGGFDGLIGRGDSCQLPALKRVNVESCRSMTGSIIPLASCKQLVSLDLSFTDLTGARAILMMGRLCPHLKRVKAVLAPRIMFRLDKSHVAMIKRLEPSQDHSADRFNKPNWAQFATELRRKRPDLDVTTDVTAK